MPNASQAEAVLGGGCFWCLEAVYKELAGVLAVKSGYAGGPVENPTYKLVCRGTTDHAEVVRVTYDPSVLRYADLLRVFFTIHDPTTRDQQGNDFGTQYRSIILVANDEELRVAHEVMTEITAAGLFKHPLVTEVVRLDKFWPAEAEHDDYFARNPGSGYCQVVVSPKVTKFRQKFANRLKTGVAA